MLRGWSGEWVTVSRTRLRTPPRCLQPVHAPRCWVLFGHRRSWARPADICQTFSHQNQTFPTPGVYFMAENNTQFVCVVRNVWLIPPHTPLLVTSNNKGQPSKPVCSVFTSRRVIENTKYLQELDCNFFFLNLKNLLWPSRSTDQVEFSFNQKYHSFKMASLNPISVWFKDQTSALLWMCIYQKPRKNLKHSPQRGVTCHWWWPFLIITTAPPHTWRNNSIIHWSATVEKYTLVRKKL